MSMTIKCAANRLVITCVSFLTSISSFAQRVTSEDIYGESGGGGGEFLGTIILLLLGAAIVRGFFTNKGFRLGVLAYVGVVGGILLVYKFFGKDAGIAAAIVVMIILWIIDKESTGKK
jgi:hypothetical protein